MNQDINNKTVKQKQVKRFTPTLAVNDLFDNAADENCLPVKVLSDHSYAIDEVKNVTEM